ncbi:MAG: transcriptional regulator [Phycisphaerae bacterium]|nr:transcriptional regulator [Phycisphaerae bacterium]
MDEMTFQQKMAEIMNRIRDLPESDRAAANDHVNQVADRREKITKSVAELQESLDYLRLSVKYLIFDLEATRRENAYLRKMIEQTNRDAERRRAEEEDEA